MDLLGIVLIFIGIIIIAISCILVDRSSKTVKDNTGASFSLESSLTETEKNKLMEQLQSKLSDLSEETIIHADDIMSKISNEKIISLNEFSDQILEKIKRNHEEVVFLYNMLNDKEKELKAVVREIDQSKRKLQGMMENKEDDAVMQGEKATSKPKAPVESIAASNQAQEKAVRKPVATGKETSPEEEPVSESMANSELSENYKKQILALASQGLTVMEISKQLGLGQGEVKLVIDLFKGNK